MTDTTTISSHFNGNTLFHDFYAPEEEARLQPRIEALLQVLSREAGKTVSRQQLLDEIWGGDPACDGALTVAICTLRRQLQDDSLHPRFVETVRGQGYRLIAPVSASDCRREQPPAFRDEKDRGDDRKTRGYSIFGDLMRRRVFRALALYVCVSWIILQVGDLTFEPLGVPRWCLTLLVLLVGLGFPIAALLAWAFEITPDGVVLDVPRENAATGSLSKSGRSMYVLIIACLACALVAMGFRLIQLEWLDTNIEPPNSVTVTVLDDEERTTAHGKQE